MDYSMTDETRISLERPRRVPASDGSLAQTCAPFREPCPSTHEGLASAVHGRGPLAQTCAPFREPCPSTHEGLASAVHGRGRCQPLRANPFASLTPHA
jgi:hypothetical protein